MQDPITIRPVDFLSHTQWRLVARVHTTLCWVNSFLVCVGNAQSKLIQVFKDQTADSKFYAPEPLPFSGPCHSTVDQILHLPFVAPQFFGQCPCKAETLLTSKNFLSSLAWHVETLDSNGAGLLICDTRNEGLLDKLKSPRVHLTAGTKDMSAASALPVAASICCAL